MATKYDIGDVARLVGTFETQAGTDVDPSQVLVRIKDPFGVITVLTFGVDADVMKDAVGQYHYDIYLDAEGEWSYRWEGKVTNRGAGEKILTVIDSNFYKSRGDLIPTK